MSVDFFAICRAAAPADLERLVASQTLPFSFHIEPYDTWRASTLAWIAELETRSDFVDDVPH